MALSIEITATLDRLLQASEILRDIIVANAILVGEIPAPTGEEAARACFIVRRLSESGIADCGMDDLHSAIGVLKGTAGRRALVVATNIDTLLEESAQQTIEVQQDYLIGPFVVDNCIAAGALLTLPSLFEQSGLQLKSDLILVFAAQCHKHANLKGFRRGLESLRRPLESGLWVESVQLGRLNYSCLGVRRGEIICRLPDNYDWSHYGATGTIIPMSDIVNRIAQISLPRRPLTTLVLGRIEGGVHYQNIAREVVLGFELRSEDAVRLADIEQRIRNIATDVASTYGINVTVDFFARREPGGLPLDHALVCSGRALLERMGIPVMIYPTTSPMSAMTESGIPAVTLGLTTGIRKPELDEWDELASISQLPRGLAQVAALLVAMDEEACCEKL